MSATTTSCENKVAKKIEALDNMMLYQKKKSSEME